MQQLEKRRPEVVEEQFSSDSDEQEDRDEEEQEQSEEEESPELFTARDQKILQQRDASEAQRRAVVPYTNKQRVLILCSRGVTTRYRHFMQDLRALMPHHRTEIKHDSKKNLYELNEICEMKNCNSCMFLEVRKKQDLFLWLAIAPLGPSIRFLVSNVHTMDELQMNGNCLLGSRPLLSFSADFDKIPNLQLAQQLLVRAFGTPKGHPKSKPFIDRVMNFTYLDGRIWVRNYQISPDERDEASFELMEIGPRFVLTISKVLDGSFGGRPLYENPKYVSPNEQRAQVKRMLGKKYVERKRAERNLESKKIRLDSAVPEDPLSTKNVFGKTAEGDDE